MTQVLEAAARIVAAFGAHDTVGYFRGFAADATFVFHTTAQPVRSLSDYEQLWYGWERDGFRVLSCESTDQHVQPVGEDVAIFTHRVRTVVRLDGAEQTLDERETIVFHKRDGQWLAVHEHLSGAPE
ncbi:nuclear transport factor 2 family protein [Actinoplanes sichuanensis]|uniref:YybH family protein n=1 Tax=Actinoplanes sichuanensis TaxID=512349 RepID=A0ABW4A8I0_9ACTN|nr:nuclear transport factor 2 family protein [Actinoplanes sichuanensis]BEL03640.1 nuclear transport factor 2 family protein [Actinoplanes sichuanensis]